MRIVPSVLSSLAVVVVSVGARGAGSIDTAGATFSFGASPDQGTLTTDAAAPAAPAPAIATLASHGTLGTFSSPLPAFAGGGTGADGPFTAAATQTLPGGTYNYTTYQVNPGVEVTYSGAVTIRCTTGGTISGTVRTTAANAPISLRFARGLELGDGAAIRTESESSPVTIDMGHGFLATLGAAVEATGGDVEVTSHGLDATSGDVEIEGATLRTFSGGAVRVRAAGALKTSGAAFLSSYAGGMLLQAFGGDLTMGGSSRADTYGNTDTITVEASGGVAITGDGTRAQLYHGGGGALLVKALGGDAQFLGATQVTTGAARVAASGNVRVAGTSRFSIGGDATLTAFGGDVRVEPTGGAVSVLTVEDTFLGATGNVVLSGVGTLRSGGQIDLRAPAGKVSATTGIVVGLSTDLTGAVSMSAGAGGIDLDGAAVFSNAALDVTALGPVTIGGAIGARSHVTVTSCDAGVDLTGASFQTLATAGTSGDVTVQSFADAAGVLDAAGVSFTTDPAATKSGDVNLIVRAGKIGGAPAPVSIDAYLLPKSVAVSTNAKVPAKSKVTISGVVDEGSANPCYTEPLSLEVGKATFPIPGMTAKGRTFEYSAPGLLLRITPARTASSRGAFLLVRTGDVAGEVDRDGALNLRVVGTGIDAKGVVNLRAGKFTLGRVRGDVILPCYFPASTTATLRGPGKDTLSIVAGFSFDGYTAGIGGPGDINPCFTIAVGGTFTATIDRDLFVLSKRGDRLTFKGDVNGITSVVIDAKAEKITVKGSRMTLAGVTAASGPLAISMSLDTVARGLDTRTVTVGLNLAGKSLKY
jgi:hypothetical protein